MPFFTDDYIMPNGSYNPFAYFQRKRVTKRFKNIISSSSEMFVIGELMMEEYSSKFGKKFSIVSNYPQSNKIILPKKVRENDEPLKLIYSGNIELGRFKKLLDIAYAIEKLSKIGLNINLYIYSLQKPLRNDLKKINELSSTKFMGSLQDSDKIKNTIKEADIVLHVESDKKKFKKITKYSVSTKISEYLSYSKCILAYGPHDIASMSYLEKYKSALICHDKKDVYDKLYKIYKDRNIQIYYENKAMELFKLKKNTLVVEDIIISAANQ